MKHRQIDNLQIKHRQIDNLQIKHRQIDNQKNLITNKLATYTN